MESSRSKRRRLMLSYFPSSPDLPATFESLNDDTLTTILQFVGNKSYRSFGGLNKRCKEVYLNTQGMTKETFLYGYGPLSVITDRYDSNPFFEARNALCKGVVFYNRRDVLALVIQRRDISLLNRICELATEEGRIDILEEMWNNVNDRDDRGDVFYHVDIYTARFGKLNVLKWTETKGISIGKQCAEKAAHYGQLHIMKWLQEEQGLELKRELYYSAINGGNHLHVMKWLREQEVDWDKWAFRKAAEKGNLDILQWLHDEGCPWDDDDRYCAYELDLKPEVIEWCRSNGYNNRILMIDFQHLIS